jgi:hypothetical protein
MNRLARAYFESDREADLGKSSLAIRPNQHR